MRKLSNSTPNSTSPAAAGKRGTCRPAGSLNAEGRRGICCLLAVALTLCFAGCGGRGPANEPDYADPKPTDGSWTATSEQLERAKNVALTNELLIGCWIPPRPGQMKTQEDADARMAELAASGLNCVSTHNSDLSNMKFIYRLCEAAEKCGVKVIIELSRDLSKSGIRNNVRVVEKTKDYAAVLGYNLFDEPLPTEAAALASEFAAIREVTGDSKLLLINLLPNYGRKEDMAPTLIDGLTWYQTYLETFGDTGTDVLSFDFYPFSAKPERDAGRIASMLENLSDVAFIAKQHDLPTWGFVQNSSWNGMREPNGVELRFLCHLHLIFGLESYSYFLYAETSNGGEGSFSAMLTSDSNLTEMYYRVQENNRCLKNSGYRFLSYSLKGFLTDKLTANGYADRIHDTLKLDGDNDLVSFEAECDTLIGVFEGRSAEDNTARGYAVDNAAKGFYLLNCSSEHPETVTLKFNGVTPYTVWGPEGIEAMGAASELRVELWEYDGKFVELKTFGTD